MDQVGIQLRDDIDRDILVFIRDMHALEPEAPITAESVLAFLRGPRRRTIEMPTVRDRLAYLLSAEYLDVHHDWAPGGGIESWAVTAAGVDLLDGVTPPRNWRPKAG